MFIISITFCSSLNDVVKELQKNVDKNEKFNMLVRRGHVLEDAVRRSRKDSFSPTKKIVVSPIQFPADEYGDYLIKNWR